MLCQCAWLRCLLQWHTPGISALMRLLSAPNVKYSASVLKSRLLHTPVSCAAPVAASSTTTSDTSSKQKDRPRQRGRKQQKQQLVEAVAFVQDATTVQATATTPDVEPCADPPACGADPPAATQLQPTTPLLPQASDVPNSLSELVPVPSADQLHFHDTPFVLRPYQIQAIQTVISEWKHNSVNAQMVMLPTGSGKTVVFAALARYLSMHYMAPNGPAAPGSVAGSADGGPEQEGAEGELAGLPQPPASGPATPATAAAAAAESLYAAGATTHAASSASAASASAEDALADVSAAQQLSFSSAPTPARRRLRSRVKREAVAPELLPETLTSTSSSLSSPSTPHTIGIVDSRASTSTSSISCLTASNPLLSSTSTNTTSTCTTLDSEDWASSTDSSSREALVVSARRGRGRPKQQPQPEEVAPPGVMKVLVLAHRHDLLHQAEEKFKLMWGPDLSVSWVKGKRKELYGQVVVASVATVVNCIPDLVECKFSLVVVDEAHHSVANTYKAVLQGLGFIRELDTPEPSSDTSDASALDEVQPRLLTQQQEQHQLLQQREQQQQDGSDSLMLPGQQHQSQGPAEVQANHTSSSSSSSIDSGSDSEEGCQGQGSSASHVPSWEVIPNSHQLLVGFSATPYRMKIGESRQLYDIFTTTFSQNIWDMIRAKTLCRVKGHKILTGTDLKGAGGGAEGDFITARLSKLVNSRSRNRLVLQAYIQHCTIPADPAHTAAATGAAEPLRRSGRRESSLACAQSEPGAAAGANRVVLDAEELDESRLRSAAADDDDVDGSEDNDRPWTGGLTVAGRRAVRKTLGFAVDIKHAEALNDLFEAAGVRSSVVHSQMPHELTRQELARFRRGDLDVLFNVEQLTEGFDEPSIGAILMARPTRSQGLYTQMLGRGLRLAPGKEDCLVLDFTDKQHKAGRVVDLRVLLEQNKAQLAQGGGPPPERGPASIAEGARGGEVDVVESSMDPAELAWLQLGPHWYTSVFSAGAIWLVNIAGMGRQQRQRLGLRERPSQQQQQGQQAQEQAHMLAGVADVAGAGDDSDDDEYDNANEEDRYVVLHQPQKNIDASTWLTIPFAGGSRGLSKDDAYGASIDYIQALVQKEQLAAVKAWRAGKRRPPSTIDQFKHKAAWRSKPASQAQLALLKIREVHTPERLTCGEASDLLSRSFAALATQQQLRELQSVLDAEAFEGLPVPLLSDHAAQVLKHKANGGSRRRSNTRS